MTAGAESGGTGTVVRVEPAAYDAAIASLDGLIGRVTQLIQRLSSGPNPAWFTASGAAAAGQFTAAHDQLAAAAQALQAKLTRERAAHHTVRNGYTGVDRANATGITGVVRNASVLAPFSGAGTSDLLTLTVGRPADDLRPSVAQVPAFTAAPVRRAAGLSMVNFPIGGISGTGMVANARLSGSPDSLTDYGRDIAECAAEFADIEAQYLLLHDTLGKTWQGPAREAAYRLARTTAQQVKAVSDALKTLGAQSAGAGQTLASVQQLVGLLIKIFDAVVSSLTGMGMGALAQAVAQQGQGQVHAFAAQTGIQLQTLAGQVQLAVSLATSLSQLDTPAAGAASTAPASAVPAQGTSPAPPAQRAGGRGAGGAGGGSGAGAGGAGAGKTGSGAGAGAAGNDPIFGQNGLVKELIKPGGLLNKNPGTAAAPSATNPLGTATNPFGGATNPFGTGGSPLGTATNPFGTTGNPFGAGAGPAGGNPNGAGGNPYAATGNPFQVNGQQSGHPGGMVYLGPMGNGFTPTGNNPSGSVSSADQNFTWRKKPRPAAEVHPGPESAGIGTGSGDPGPTGPAHPPAHAHGSPQADGHGHRQDSRPRSEAAGPAPAGSHGGHVHVRPGHAAPALVKVA